MQNKSAWDSTHNEPIPVSEIILNVNNVGFDSLLSIKEIQTEEDKEKYSKMGYYYPQTEAAFHDMIPELDTGNIWCTPSIAQPMLYFNRETLAALPCHIEMLLLGKKDMPEKMVALARKQEGNVRNMDFRSSIQALPEAMRMEYFNLLLDKFPETYKDIPYLFRLFFGNYLTVSYGFDRVRPDVFRKIAEMRPSEEAEEVQRDLADYPETLRIYRGGSTTVSRPPEEANSWTTSIQAALFFAGRLGCDSGYIAYATVPKSKVIYSQMDTMEKEVIVYPEDVVIEDRLNLAGLDELYPVIKQIVSLYHVYRDSLYDLDFQLDSDQHGRLHSARVLLLSLLIAQMMNLPSSEKHILATAAIYHDSMRDNDGEDLEHGKWSAEYYRDNAEVVDPIVDFLIEFHCRPDEEGYSAIRNSRKLSRNRSKTKRLFDIFKDADALDRVRFGWMDLDLNQLRTPVAKTLPLFAKHSVKMIEL